MKLYRVDVSQWFPASLNMLFIKSAYKNPLSPQDGKPQDANYSLSVVLLLLFTFQINKCIQGDSILHYANFLACHF